MTMLVIGAPSEYPAWLGELPPGARLIAQTRKPVAAAHVFATDRHALETQLRSLRTRLQPDGFVWVSWPKKASKVPTNITEDSIRDLALPLGFVDIKVCAVSEIWSGLKLVIRKSERPAR